MCGPPRKEDTAKERNWKKPHRQVGAPVPSPHGNERFARRGSVHCRLTVKLRGRAPTPARRRGRTISSRARGAQPPARHGPFQRWLEDALIEATVRARNLQRKPELPETTNPATLSGDTAATGEATGASAAGGFPPARARTSGSIGRRVLASDLQIPIPHHEDSRCVL
jgi:hypothetical protein